MQLSWPIWQRRREWGKQEPWGPTGGSKLVFLEAPKLPSKVSRVSLESGLISVVGSGRTGLVLAWRVWVTFSM